MGKGEKVGVTEMQSGLVLTEAPLVTTLNSCSVKNEERRIQIQHSTELSSSDHLSITQQGCQHSRRFL